MKLEEIKKQIKATPTRVEKLDAFALSKKMRKGICISKKCNFAY